MPHTEAVTGTTGSGIALEMEGVSGRSAGLKCRRGVPKILGRRKRSVSVDTPRVQR